MSNKVEKLSTSIEVLCTKKDLQMAFPRWNENAVLHVFHQERKIWTERAPSGDVKKLLDILKRSIPSLGYVVEKYDTPSEYYIKMEGNNYDLWDTESKDRCRVEVTSYEDNLDKHYELVGRIKALLILKGFKVYTGVCEVTKKIIC